MEMPTNRQLECFAAVFETLNFRQAAEKCYISQPALSAQIKQFEQLLGILLFERDKRRVLPTAAAKSLFPKVERILRDTRILAEDSHRFGEPFSGTLRLGVIPTVAPYLLPKTIRALHREFPQVRLSIREDHTERLVESLEEGDLDVLLLALEADLGSAETIDIVSDPFWLVVDSKHPLAERQRIAFEDIAQENILLLDDGHCLRDQTLEICNRVNAKGSDDFRASSLPTLLEMVAGGLGVSLLPEMAIETECRPGRGLTPLPYGDTSPSRTIGLAFRASSHRQPEYTLLADLLRREM